jgi:hypothetical protein
MLKQKKGVCNQGNFTPPSKTTLSEYVRPYGLFWQLLCRYFSGKVVYICACVSEGLKNPLLAKFLSHRVSAVHFGKTSYVSPAVSFGIFYSMQSSTALHLCIYQSH